MPNRAAEFETVPVRVRGIPARARIDGYEPPDPGNEWTPPAPERIEWTICDRSGYYAPWLERYLDDETVRDVHDQVVAGIHKRQRDDRAEAAIAQAERRGII